MRGGDGKEKKNAPEKDKRTKLRKTREKRKTKIQIRYAGLQTSNVPWLQILSLLEAPGWYVNCTFSR